MGTRLLLNIRDHEDRKKVSGTLNSMPSILLRPFKVRGRDEHINTVEITVDVTTVQDHI
ncbi:hypothetical protein M422DRAFT_33559 [Sphaerobolus stellatus SS14]|uniref:Unplaced genomic scaffold SPHSTscaffold_91, whole genome shotgun sequence n=1 Tax=Sphaerobolus stellatus (strain SS14) TaxID=990650 RepID=A0A0C9VJM5_SPHS4|nr:hypothetical protein M422DRAFT_33559 [Sphaerobolus stellatus SS14]